MSLKVLTFSTIDLYKEIKGVRLTLRGHTENPRWIYRSRYVSDRRKLPTPSEEHTEEDGHTNRECSELAQHAQSVVWTFATEQNQEGRGSYRPTP